ncbi:hypothetical protein [Enterocloster hominis (ex Hitch et al. 2024)]|uniref:DNA-binding protein n=1 Tax=Enterocloster hominis (ex Hitch et al. 2024) TaxID=1917870 RepID=A0ABV1D7F1_9FIRM
MFEAYEDLIRIEDLCEMLGIGKNTAYGLLQNKKSKPSVLDVPGKSLKNQLNHTYFHVVACKKNKRAFDNQEDSSHMNLPEITCYFLYFS